MNWAQIVRDLRAEFRNYVETALLDLFSYTKTSKPSKNGRDDKIEGRTSEGSEDKADSDVQRVQHYGFRSIPPVGTWAVSAKVGGQKFTLGEDSTKYAPTDLEEGELALFNSQSGVQVKLTKNGEVLIDAKSGQDIKFNGGTKKVARVDDTTKCGWLVFSPNVPPGGAASLSYLPPSTFPVPTVIMYPAPLVLLALTGVIDSGADHVLA